MEKRDLLLCAGSPLFRGIAPAQLEPLLASLQAHRRDCRRGGLLFAAGESVDELGLVLRGSVHIVYEDVFGERSIINTMAEGQIFCGAFSCAGTPLPVSILAQTDCTVLLIRTRYLLEDGLRGADGQPLLAQNLLQVLASLYVALVDKVIHLSRRTTRQKLLSYLAAQQQLTGGGAFSVPYSRQELAEFLFVERSGLSTEWNRLLREGILCAQGGQYRLDLHACRPEDRPE